MLEADAKHSFATETTGSETRGDLTLNNIDIGNCYHLQLL